MSGKGTKEVTLSILGMQCEHCAANLEKALLGTDGVEKATVRFATKSAHVAYDESKIDLSGISNVVSDAGYQIGDCDMTHKRIRNVPPGLLPAGLF